jgi:uncharacterized protein
MHVLYLHGFASSPESSKAAFFQSRLAAHGGAWSCPDLNAPEFSTLTASRMIGQAEAYLRTLPDGPAALIGSSLGGFVAWHVAARAERAAREGRASARPVDRLVLLAPAFDFGRADMHDIGEAGLEEWRRAGWREFFHYAYEQPRPVHYELYRDAQRYDSFASPVRAPTLVFQGRRDDVVDPDMVARFADGRPNVTLHLVDDDHQLKTSLEGMWDPIATFLGLDRRREG